MARKTAVYPDDGGLDYCCLGLGSEAGEVLGIAKRVLRDHDGEWTRAEVDELRDELGDVLWHVSQLAFEAGLSLDVIAKRNLEKLAARVANGTLQGKGSSR